MSYQVALDKNGDGFICLDSLPGDALNLLPHAIEYAPLSFDTSSSTTAALHSDETLYGLRRFRITFTGSGAGAFDLGKVGGTIDSIPVSASSPYSVGVWVRGITDYTALPLDLNVYNQSGGLIASVSQGPGVDWTRHTVTFTTGVSDTHIYISLEKPAGHPSMEVNATGYMLVAGDTLPDAFNTGAASDLDDAITPDVVAMHWRLGFAKPYDAVSAPTVGRIIVRNRDGAYSPELAAITLDPGTPVRIRVTLDSQTFTLFTGAIRSVEPETGSLAGRTATIYLTGPEQRLADVRILTPLLVNTQAKAVIEAALNHPALNRHNRSLDDGVSTFAYVGDTWEDGIPSLRAIRRIVEAERGRFFSDRNGHLVFHDRAHAASSASATFADEFDALTYTYGETLVNHVRVAIRPRAVGSAGSVIWTLSTPQRIPPGECRTVTARLRDSAGNPMGATNVTAPVPTTDYSANTASDGSGTDVTAQVSVTIASGGTYASAITLEVCNASGADAYLLAGAQIRGTPLIQGDAMRVEAIDMPSVLQHGLHVLEYNLPYFVTAEEAEELAQAQVDRFKTPSGAVKTLTLSSRTRLPDALPLTLFDTITVTETRTGHSGDYAIIAEEHTVDLGGFRHVVTWLLEAIAS